MKNYIKFLPVIAGIVLATFGSIDQAKASVQDETASLGWCAPCSSPCGITPQGTIIFGKWMEGPGVAVQ